MNVEEVVRRGRQNASLEQARCYVGSQRVVINLEKRTHRQ